MMQLVMSSISFAVLVSGPPAICTPKPNRTADTIKGKIARRLNSSVKSGLVKKLTIISVMPNVSPISPSVTVYCPLTSGKIRQTMYISTPAIAAVDKKVTIVLPINLPARFTFFMLAMADEMEKNTMGTTTQNIMFTNNVPRNARLPAKSGRSAPTIQPRTMPESISKMKRLLLRKVFIEIPPPISIPSILCLTGTIR